MVTQFLSVNKQDHIAMLSYLINRNILERGPPVWAVLFWNVEALAFPILYLVVKHCFVDTVYFSFSFL